MQRDAALVQRVATGDDHALAALYDRYGHVAYGLALRIVRDRGLAEDAVQEAFLAAWRSAAAYDPARSSPQTWLLTFVHRRAVDAVRSRARRPSEPLPEEPYDDHEGGADDDAFLALERQRVRRALASLPADERRALELAYYGGLSQTEIAQRLGVPLGTVKSRTFSALARLRTLLADPTQSSGEAQPAEPAAVRVPT